MRGEHGLEAEAFMARRRFIPACAGNTRDQPLCRPNAYGSSPHARGTPIKIKINIVRLPVHPRMRGEHSIDLTTRFDRYGSSPHARGTLYRFNNKIRPIRFIPACAGNTECFNPDNLDWHGSSPHARGTRGLRLSQKRCSYGSSPHARGTLHGLIVP